MTRLLLLLALCSAPLPALAHKVIAGVFPAGKAIEGEVGFSNGTMAAEAEIIVTGPQGEELGRTTTDADGFFIFVPAINTAHTFHADLGAGHVANVTLSAAEVAQILGDAPQPSQSAGAGATGQSATQVAAPAFTPDQRQAIAEAVRNEIRPLRREIAAYREKNDLQTILGGIGYIVGLFGLGFYIAARRKLAA